MKTTRLILITLAIAVTSCSANKDLNRYNLTDDQYKKESKKNKTLLALGLTTLVLVAITKNK